MGKGRKFLRHSALIAAIAAIFACVSAASASAAPLLWTANSAEGSVSTFDSGTNQETGSPIKVGAGPNSIAITPNGRRAVVISEAGKSVTVLETATRSAVGTVTLGSPGEQVAISPDGKVAYVTAASDERVYEISTETAKGVGSFAVGPGASSVAVSPDGTRAYVGTDNGVAVVETATGNVLGQPIATGGVPTSIVVTPDGKTVYATSAGVNGIAAIGTARGELVRNILLTAEPTALAISPSGKLVYASSEKAGTVTSVETASNAVVGSPLKVGKEPDEIALTPSGATAYVAVTGEGTVQPIDTATGLLGVPIKVSGRAVRALVVAPDQSPTAVFAPPSPIATFPAAFEGFASTDPDGSIAAYEWAFGDGTVASGPSVSHTYRAPGTFSAQLGVVDNEGCGSGEVFTGRTAYCSGGASLVSHPVVATAPPAVCSAKFGIGSLTHKRKNGTARLQVKLPAAGFLLLFGKKVHAVTRKVKAKGSMFLTIHARVELNKRLKKIHRSRVRVRVTFTPNAGCGFKTVHRSFALLRSPRKHHHG